MSETSERVKTAHEHHPSSFLFPGNWCPGMWSASWMFWLVSRILTENSYITLGSKTVKGLHDWLYNSPNFIPFPSSLNHPSSQHTHAVSYKHTTTHIQTHTHTASHTQTHTQSHTLKHTTTHIQTYTHCLTHSHSLMHSNTHIQTQTHNHMYSHTHTHTCFLTLPDQASIVLSPPTHINPVISASAGPLLCPSHSLSEAHASSVTNLNDWLTSFGGGISELLFPMCKSNGFFLTFAPSWPFCKTYQFLPCTLVLRVCVCVCVCVCVPPSLEPSQMQIMPPASLHILALWAEQSTSK